MRKKRIVTVIVALLVVSGIGMYMAFYNDSKKIENEVKESKEDSKTEEKKILVAYFSVPETDDPNKQMSQEEENSAIVVDGKVLGNTQYVAQLINENVGGDLYRIELTIPYTTDHEALVNQAKEEQNKDARPEIKDIISNFEDYDVIFIGYPIWWSYLPQIMYTFLEQYDFSSKTIMPFSTHGGSGLSKTVASIKETLNDANVEENAFTMSRDDMEKASEEELITWLKEIHMLP